MQAVNRAVVVFSGGQDSTTCLGWALKRYKHVEAITFLYGQKHAIEEVQARAICEKLSVKQTVVEIPLAGLVESALTSNGDVNDGHKDRPHLPASFVPNRNAVFLSLAHGYAQRIGAMWVVTGVCETDYSGYPDCRQKFIEQIETTLNTGSDSQIIIQTPLMARDKADVFRLAEEVGVLTEVITLSHTCYNGIREEFHPWGFGCGECPACELRAKGWKEYAYRYKTVTEGPHS
jgi:7-cyano-7-deazaguanine synthase